MGTKKRDFFIAIITLSMSIAMVACNNGERESASATTSSTQIKRVAIDTLYPFTDFETHNIARPSIVKVLQNGQVAVGDFAQKNISLINPNGELVTSFGREGRGPGEFMMPVSVTEIAGSLHIVDRNELRVSRFSFNGEFIDSYGYQSSGIGATAEVMGDSVFVISTGGRGGNLLQRVDLKNDSTLAFGEPMGEAVDGLDFQKALSQLQKGEMPAFFKNMVTLYHHDSDIYAFLNSYSILHKYNQDGALQWEKDINLPYNQRLIDQTIERSKQMQGRGIPTFAFITDLRVYDDGIYLLTPGIDDDPQLLVKLDHSGNTNTIYSLPGGHSQYFEFSLNPQTRDFYLGSFQDGTVYRGELPSSE